MRLSNKKILIVELTDSHDETMVSWYHSLKQEGAEVHVCGRSEILQRCQIPDAPSFTVGLDGGWLARMQQLHGVVRYIKANSINSVVITTAAGTLVRDFLLLLGKRVPCVGVVHNVGRIGKSWNQKVIERRLQAYAVISPNLLECVSGSEIPIHVVPQTYPVVEEIPTSSEKFTVVIPGYIEGLRKDYTSMLNDAFMQAVPDNVRFVFLGDASGNRPDRVEFRRAVERYSKNCSWYNHHVSPQEFHSVVQRADIILPLIHPNCKEYDEFLTIKSSGAFTLAWTYNKPLFLERGFTRFQHLRVGSVFYSVDELATKIHAVATNPAMLRNLPTVPWDAAFRQASTVQILLQPQSPLTVSL